MSTNINVFNRSPTEMAPTPAPAPAARPPRSPSSRTQSLPAQVDLSPRDAVDAEAGMKEHVAVPKKDLGRRTAVALRQAPLQQRQSARQKGGTKKLNQSEAAQAVADASLHLDAVDEMLDMLRDDSSQQGRELMQQMLSESYTPIEQYRVLFDVLQLIDEQGISNYRKKQFKNILNEMMSELTARDSSVREALQEANLEARAAEGFHRSLVAAAQADGAFQSQLSPLTLLTKIIQHFSVDNSEKALDSVSAQLLSGL